MVRETAFASRETPDALPVPRNPRITVRVGVIDIAVKDENKRLTWRFIASVITFGFAVLFLVWGFNFFMEDLAFGPQTATLRYPLIYARSSFFLSAGILGGVYFLLDMVDLARQRFWHKPPLKALIRGFEDGCSYESYVIRCHPGGDDEKVVGSPGLQDSR